MSDIIKNLNDPSWWFTGCFFGALFFSLKAVSKKLPSLFTTVARRQKLKKIRYVRSMRDCCMGSIHEIVRVNNLVLFSCLITLLALLLLFNTDLVGFPVVVMFCITAIIFDRISDEHQMRLHALLREHDKREKQITNGCI